jgi:hypothetical protein
MLLRKPVLLIALLCLPIIIGFRESEVFTSPFSNLHRTLVSCLADAPQRKASVVIADNGILKYYLTYKNGMEEHFSLNLLYFQQIEYLGTTDSGTLIIKSDDSKVICQSFHDPKGDIDQLENEIPLMVNRITAEQLNSIHEDLTIIKTRLIGNNRKL